MSGLDIYGAILEARRPKGKYIKWERLENKLREKGVNGYDIDIRYLKRWIDKYPDIFPKFMREDRYEPYFEYDKNGDIVWHIYIIAKRKRNVK